MAKENIQFDCTTRGVEAFKRMGQTAIKVAFKFEELQKLAQLIQSLKRIPNPSRKWYQFWKPKTIVIVTK